MVTIYSYFIFQYKLFYLKLQKSLDYVTVELRRFQEDQVDRNNLSMLELILTPKKNKMSDYTLNEWTDIETNLKSSLIFMEQIIVSVLLYIHTFQFKNNLFRVGFLIF